MGMPVIGHHVWGHVQAWEWVVDMFRLMTPNDTSPNVEKEKDHN